MTGDGNTTPEQQVADELKPNGQPDGETDGLSEHELTEAVQAEPDPYELLQAENAELKDRALRALAEVENIRRRLEREKAEATLYAATNFARDLLSVADNLNRALDSMPEDQLKDAGEAVKNIVSGVEVTRRELINTFERHGIRQIDPKGEKFNPNVHQAMFEVPDADAEPGTIKEVVQTGYMIGERVLRPALVGVSKAAPGDGKKTAADPTAN